MNRGYDMNARHELANILEDVYEGDELDMEAALEDYGDDEMMNEFHNMWDDGDRPGVETVTGAMFVGGSMVGH